ncbi:unnamed protein product [Cladocopium goreaui]|uniref:Pyrroline-5-carboxylate reductase n=1 Tax=Cladocopium goreaui TaxID=2562237 RepID=A0A9P1FMN4_9DINO|nr:unnamed protein product [Cladocopium goreaui]|mmetsp:Transcript_46782/g.101839  ORF Transcript_46782/g.101839 Transcript_46782/m.101839 type:complete len:272 (-) Transcript_46782:72-887(-)
MQALSIGFLGGGQMCEALLGGLLAQGTTEGAKVLVSEPLEARRKYLEQKFSVKTTESNSEVVTTMGKGGVVVLAVKPQVAAAALNGLTMSPETSPLFISIMAGVTIAKLMDMGVKRVARTMPNTPSLVGLGASAYVLGPGASSSDGAIVERVMSAVGLCEKLGDEKLLDAVTGLSGSGPAYVYMMIESMADGGVKNGLPRDVALRLAAQTVLGSAKMTQGEKHPAQLKNAVESPGGTTIAGTATLESLGFRHSVISAVTAAKERATELGKL